MHVHTEYVPSSLGIAGVYVVVSSCSHGCSDSNSNPHVHIAILSPTEPPPCTPSLSLLVSDLMIRCTVEDLALLSV